MTFDFELILFYLILISGFISLLDIIFWAHKRKLTQQKMPIIIDYARSFFPVLLIVFLLRSFLYEPFRIPSGSLKPTLDIGDFLLVNKYNYGVRLPILRTKLFGEGTPKRGEIMVFRWPANPTYYFIKRVIGLPGDHISYINKIVYVNNKPAPQEMLQNSIDIDESGRSQMVLEKQEDLLGVKHPIYQSPDRSGGEYRDIIVPPGMYFVMGDNRDASLDSRYWGFVPDKNIVGRAAFVWMSWNSDKFGIRWNRIGKRLP